MPEGCKVGSVQHTKIFQLPPITGRNKLQIRVLQYTWHSNPLSVDLTQALGDHFFNRRG